MLEEHFILQHRATNTIRFTDEEKQSSREKLRLKGMKISLSRQPVLNISVSIATTPAYLLIFRGPWQGALVVRYRSGITHKQKHTEVTRVNAYEVTMLLSCSRAQTSGTVIQRWGLDIWMSLWAKFTYIQPQRSCSGYWWGLEETYFCASPSPSLSSSWCWTEDDSTATIPQMTLPVKLLHSFSSVIHHKKTSQMCNGNKNHSLPVLQSVD